MASVPTENWTGAADERNDATDYEYSYYYYGDDDDDDDVPWPYVLLDVLIGVAVVVDLLLIAVVLSGRKLRRGPSAIFIISLASFDLFHLVSVRLGVYVMSQFELHPAGHLICKVSYVCVYVYSYNNNYNNS